MSDLPSVALVVKAKSARLLLTGANTLELRGRRTFRTGRIALAVAGASQLHGTIGLVSSELVGRRLANGELAPPPRGPFVADLVTQHCVHDLSTIPYRKIWAWKMRRPIGYRKPKTYTHPRGAVTWVRLSGKVTRRAGCKRVGKTASSSPSSPSAQSSSSSTSTSESSASESSAI